MRESGRPVTGDGLQRNPGGGVGRPVDFDAAERRQIPGGR